MRLAAPIMKVQDYKKITSENQQFKIHTFVATTEIGVTDAVVSCWSDLALRVELPRARGSNKLFTLSGRFFFNFAKIEDSRSGNGGISSSTVALKSTTI